MGEIAEGLGETTNNVAEYTAAIRGLERAAELGATDVVLRSDSQLLINQLSGRYRVKSEHLIPLHRRLRELARGFERIRFEHVPRERNSEADRLANEGVDAWLAGGRRLSGTVRSGGAGRAAAARRARVEESPDSEGQDAGESQAGATSRRGNREQTAARGDAVRQG